MLPGFNIRHETHMNSICIAKSARVTDAFISHSVHSRWFCFGSFSLLRTSQAVPISRQPHLPLFLDLLPLAPNQFHSVHGTRFSRRVHIFSIYCTIYASISVYMYYSIQLIYYIGETGSSCPMAAVGLDQRATCPVQRVRFVHPSVCISVRARYLLHNLSIPSLVRRLYAPRTFGYPRFGCLMWTWDVNRIARDSNLYSFNEISRSYANEWVIKIRLKHSCEAAPISNSFVERLLMKVVC